VAQVNAMPLFSIHWKDKILWFFEELPFSHILTAIFDTMNRMWYRVLDKNLPKFSFFTLAPTAGRILTPLKFEDPDGPQLDL
jgi:hypothetical protein